MSGFAFRFGELFGRDQIAQFTPSPPPPPPFPPGSPVGLLLAVTREVNVPSGAGKPVGLLISVTSAS